MGPEGTSFYSVSCPPTTAAPCLLGEGSRTGRPPGRPLWSMMIEPLKNETSRPPNTRPFHFNLLLLYFFDHFSSLPQNQGPKAEAARLSAFQNGGWGACRRWSFGDGRGAAWHQRATVPEGPFSSPPESLTPNRKRPRSAGPPVARGPPFGTFEGLCAGRERKPGEGGGGRSSLVTSVMARRPYSPPPPLYLQSPRLFPWLRPPRSPPPPPQRRTSPSPQRNRGRSPAQSI